MSRLESDNEELDKAINLARKSKSLIPKINNWCSNIKINSQYGGMIGGMGLPTMNFISCPQADGGGGMNLEWVASEFIIDNCQECKFHKEKYSKNFGREVLSKHLIYLEKANTDLEKKKKVLNIFNDKIIELVNSGDTKTTELSIYRLLQNLSDDADDIQIAKKILEATNVSADFFSEESIEYLTLFLDKEISNPIAKSIINIIRKDERKLSPFVKDKILEAITNRTEIEILIQTVSIDSLSPEKLEEIIKNLITNYVSDRFLYSRENPFEDHSPNIILFIDNYRKKNINSFDRIIRECLQNKSKSIRISVLAVLDKLFSVETSIVQKFIKEIIDAWDINEDSYGLSADVTVRKLLMRIVGSDIQVLFECLENKFSKSRIGTKIEIIGFYKEFINNQEFIINFPDYISDVFQKLVSNIHENFTNSAHKSTSRILENFSKKHPDFVKDKFELFFGVLLKAIEKKSTFLWYKDNLNQNMVTFNPLEGKDFFTINLEYNLLQQKIDDIKGIISNIISASDNIFEILKILNGINIRQENDEILKTTLIGSLKQASKKKKIFFVNSLPFVYNWLIDISSLKVRTEALDFIKNMLDIYPESVPKTIYDLLDVLVKDSDLLIKKYAIDAYGEIINYSFERANIDTVKYLIEQLDDSYTILHKTIIKFVYQIADRLNYDEKLNLLIRMLRLLEIYSRQAEVDLDFCKTLSSKILNMSKEFNPNHDVTKMKIIESFILPNCYLEDFYESKSFVDMLRDMTKEDSEIRGLWLKAAWAFLFRYKPQKLDFVSYMNYRKEFYLEMFNMNTEIISNEYENIKGNLQDAIKHNVEEFGHDIIFTFNVLNYFGLHNQIVELCEFINTNVTRIPILNYMFIVVDVSSNISKNELKFA
ncbi:hypothetical protein D3C71_06000 [compost metagenome]